MLMESGIQNETTPLPTPPSSTVASRQAIRMPLLDPLRLFLACLVVVTHAFGLSNVAEPLGRITGERMNFGDLAVDGFFVVSGLLIAQSWAISKNAGAYLLKRGARIFPLFAAVSVACTFLGYGDMSALWQIPVLGVPPETLHGYSIDLQAWTIRYEFCAYLALAALGVTGLLKRRDVLLGMVIAFAGCYIAATAHIFGDPTVQVATNVPRFGLCFGLGALLYAFRGEIPAKLGWAALALFIAGSVFGREPQLWPFSIAWGVYRLSLWQGSFRFLKGQDWSYGVYLMHRPIMLLLLPYVHGVGLLFTVGLSASIFAAMISWNFIEKPFLDAAQAWSRPRRQPQESAIEPVATAGRYTT